jgi:D-psicose/D-tagatose/L-ribulose 3-epimerase
MKIGANTMIWAGDFTQEHLPLIDKVAALGFDVIEILVTSAEPRFDSSRVRKLIRDAGLQCSVSASLTPAHDLSSANKEVRDRGISFLNSVVGTAEAIGAKIVAGPLYAKIGRLQFLSPAAEHGSVTTRLPLSARPQRPRRAEAWILPLRCSTALNQTS